MHRFCKPFYVQVSKFVFVLSKCQVQQKRSRHGWRRLNELLSGHIAEPLLEPAIDPIEEEIASQHDCLEKRRNVRGGRGSRWRRLGDGDSTDAGRDARCSSRDTRGGFTMNEPINQSEQAATVVPFDAAAEANT